MKTNSVRSIHFLLALLVVLLDRWTKRLVAARIADVHPHPDHPGILPAHAHRKYRARHSACSPIRHRIGRRRC